MPKIYPFQRYTEQYENWFAEHRWVYEAELRAVKALLPESGRGLEVGAGTGRFAEPLVIKTGLEPSARMGEIAQKRGIKVLDGVAEALPFGDGKFDVVLMVTTVCFLDDIHKAFSEAHRVLANGGFFIAGIVDRNSPIGKEYLKHQNESVFYKIATFFSVDEVVKVMRQADFKDFVFRQTIFRSLAETNDNEPVKPGYGEGSFVVIRGRKEKFEEIRQEESVFHSYPSLEANFRLIAEDGLVYSFVLKGKQKCQFMSLNARMARSPQNWLKSAQKQSRAQGAIKRPKR